MVDIYRWLDSLQSHGIKLGLENIERILSALGNPEKRFPSVLIAGTNGKGSVGAMLERIFLKHGMRAGYFLSPHLVHVTERIRVDGKNIEEQNFQETLQKVFHVVQDLNLTPTYFEALTAASFVHFAEVSVDAAAVEVGLGGRFDSTNALTQVLSVITSIGFDHEIYLGPTLENIAFEKAMITKPGVPMVVGNVPVPARKTIEQVCTEAGSPLYFVQPSNIIEPRLVEGFPVFHYAPWNRMVRVNLRGRYQIENAAVALLSVDKLAELEWKIDRERTLEALAEVRWAGRLDVIPGYVPPLLLDCAHNPMGARALAQYLNEVGWTRCIFLFTAMKDKNFLEMLKATARAAEQIVLCRVDPLERCATMAELTAAALEASISSISEPDTMRAFSQARSLSVEKNLPLVAFGSIYLIGHLYSEIRSEK